jgi:nitrite reductase/ring-hydroxylating ferredoxin subunit
LELAQVGEVRQGTMKSFLVGGRVVCGSSIDGKFCAVDDVCTHSGGELSKGELVRKVATCPDHGAKLDVTTGQVHRWPQMGLPRGSAKDETVFEVEIEDNKTKIAMEEVHGNFKNQSSRSSQTQNQGNQERPLPRKGRDSPLGADYPG